MNLGEKIYQHRRQLGLSQEELAQLLGVTRQAVSKWELGTSVPELETLVALAKAYGVTTDYLLSNECSTPKTEPVYTQSTPAQPDWLDRLPGFIGKMVRRFGWLAGVYVAFIGGIFTLFGALARFMVDSMFQSSNSNFDSLFGSSGLYSDPFFDAYNQQVSAMHASNPVSILGGFMVGLGIVLLISGILLAIWLKKKFSGEA